MNARNLLAVYERMRIIGLVSNKREFSLSWCGKGRNYLRDYVGHDRLGATVPRAVVGRLRDRLTAVAAIAPEGAAREMMSVVEEIDQAVMIERYMHR